MAEEKKDNFEQDLAAAIRRLKERTSNSPKRRGARKSSSSQKSELTSEQRELLTAIREKLNRARQEEEERQEQKLLESAIRWVENKWSGQPCPYCQQVEWQVGTPLELSALNGEVMSPAFPVMCGNCGHTTFVNAIRAGLLPEEADDK